jgi:type IV pilus assembly protein PilQ
MKFLNKKYINYLVILIFFALLGCRSGPELVNNNKDKAITSNAEVYNPLNTGKNLKDNATRFADQQKFLNQINGEDLSMQKKRRSNLNINNNNKEIKIIDLNLDIKNLESIPVTLKMDDINIGAALKIFASLVNRNILIGEEVDGTITLDFDNVKWGSAVYAILDMKGLVMEADISGLLRVHTKERYINLEKDKINTAKERFDYGLSLGSAITSKSSDSETKSAAFKIYYQTSKEMIAKIKEFISSDYPDNKIKIVEDVYNNQIIVTATDTQLSKIESVLETFDIKKKQILIEAYIVNAKDSFERRLGARVGANYSNPNPRAEKGAEQITGIVGGPATTVDTSNSTSGIAIGTSIGSLSDFSFTGTSGIGIIGRIGMARLKVEINALEAEGITETISNPKIYVMDGDNGKMTQGIEIPYTNNITTTGSTNVAGETKFIKANLELDVKPRIIGDGKILIEIKLNNDSPQTPATTGGIPPVDKQNFQSKITLDDQSIAVLGGIYTTTKGESVSKTPFFGEIPIIGNLFKSNKKEDNKTQLLVFITATII